MMSVIAVIVKQSSVIIMTGTVTYHVSASYGIGITHLLDLLVKEVYELTGVFDGVYLLYGGVGVLYVYDHCAAAEHSLSQGQHQLFVNYSVKVEFVFLDVQKALAGYELLFGEEISCEGEGKSEQGALLVCPDVVKICFHGFSFLSYFIIYIIAHCR